MAIEEREAPPAAAGIDGQPHFMGHPRGLYVIAFTEAFERFSYYGMQTLLVLYMVKALLLPGHVENIAGFDWFRTVLASLYGAPPTTQALSSHIFGVYTSLVYLTPILGGLLADRWLGKTRTVTIGALLMSAGHFMMAFEASFLLALLLLVLGVGCLKGNLASQVGALYPPGDNRTADAFQLYYIGISAGAIGAPLICGALGEDVGWHWGFGAAGVGMVIGLLIYLSGRRLLPPDAKKLPSRSREGLGEGISAVASEEAAPPPLTPPASGRGMSKRDWQVLALLIVLVPVLAVGALGNQQMFNAYLVWADRSYDFALFGMRMPTSFLVTFDAVTGVVTLTAAVAFWRWYATKWREPDELGKLVIGCAISSLAFVLVMLVAAHHAATGAKVSLWVALTVNMLNNLGFANVFPVSLALFSRASPRAIAGTMIGIYYLFLALANQLVGWVGAWLDTMDPMSFWGIHVAATVGAGVVFLVVKLVFGGMLKPA